IGWIKGDPAGAWQIDFRPGMGRARACRTRAVLVLIVEIAGDDPRPEAETAGRFGKQDRKIPACPPAAVERLGRRLGALNLTALIGDQLRDAEAQVLEQGKGIGRIAADEASRPDA